MGTGCPTGPGVPHVPELYARGWAALVPPGSLLTFGRAGSALLRLLIFLVFQVLGGARPGLQLLQDGGAKLLELAVPHGRALAQVVDGKKLNGAEALGKGRDGHVP